MKKTPTKPTVRAPGKTTYGVSSHETLAQLFKYLAHLEHKDRSAWLDGLGIQRFRQMREMPEYAKILNGVDIIFDEKCGQMAAVLPENIQNFQSPKKRLGKTR